MKIRFFRNKYFLSALGFLLFFAFTAFFSWPLPDALLNSQNQEPLRILDRNGEVLYEVRNENYGSQDKLKLENIPPQIIDALLSTEDRSFYSHPGFNPFSIIRATYQNITEGEVISGASTITQQLVRIRLKPESRSISYKLSEVYFAMRLEWIMPKEKILEEYLNSAYFGHQAYGISAASQIYFDKSISELSLAESALLIGLIQSPVSLDPFINLNLALQRQHLVLSAMLENNKITQEEYEDAIAETISLGTDKVNLKAPHFVMWLLTDYAENLENKSEIRTTLDLSLQYEVEQIIKNQIKNLEDKNVTSAAVVVLDAKKGDILSMVGSADYFDEEIDGNVNVALMPRQPGSTLKPFTYALALEMGDTPATTVADTESRFLTQEGNPYVPRNYDYLYHGLVRYREALANSYNISAVKVLEKVGVSRLLVFLESIGISTLKETPDHYGIALTLGDGEVKLLELTEAYGIFPCLGKTLHHRVFLDEEIKEGERAITAETAWLIADILSDADARLPEFGGSDSLDFSFKVGAKTGTTRNSRDNWLIGFTGDYIVGVWVGNPDNTPMRGTSGISGAGPIFHDVMNTVMRAKKPTWPKKPDNIIKQEVCRLSGKIPTDLCPHTIVEYFKTGTVPTEKDDIYQSIKIDKRNNKRAGESCPDEYTKEKVFAVFPLELEKWARENGWNTPPREYSPLCPKTENYTENHIQITRPSQGDSYKLEKTIPDENEKIILEAIADENVEKINWYIDDEKIGEGDSPYFRLEWIPKEGNHHIKATSDFSEDEIHIEILK